MGDILKRPSFAHLHKLELPDDKSEIRIGRPEQWSRGWTLSAKELTGLVQSYFALPGPKTADTCLEYILKKRREDLISKDFSFTRIVRTDVDDDDSDVVGRTVA
jgi:hypothetical protein